MTEYVILYGKKYPKSLITYILSKPLHENKSINQLPEKYLDEMKEVVKDDFERNGIGKGHLSSFYSYSIPLWMDIAEAKGYELINIKTNETGVQADVVKKSYRKKRLSKRKVCRCKK